MSVYSNAGNVTLGDLIEHLRRLPPGMVVERGFGRPHSYRGYYEDVAFAPEANVTVGQMLKCAEEALGQTFEGWKGGEFTMKAHTDCWFAERGSTGIPIVLPGEPSCYVLPDVRAKRAED